MQVTEVTVTIANQGKLRAYVVIVIDGSLAIHGLRTIEGTNGLFVSMPSRKQPDGNIADIVHPINTQTREMVEHSVLTEYQRVLRNSKSSVPRPT
jgi:stage V sporulation protein G